MTVCQCFLSALAQILVVVRWYISLSPPKPLFHLFLQPEPSFILLISNSLLSSQTLFLCHLSCSNFAQVSFAAIQHPPHTSVHCFAFSQLEISSDQGKFRALDVNVYLLPESSCSAKFQPAHTSFIKVKKRGVVAPYTLQLLHCPSTFLLGLQF